MPAQLTYPGVYIEEVPSGVRTISGVATSITAFLGGTARGPVDEAVTITSFADFERTFGGLAYAYPLSYSVRDFFSNGGGQAVIVRLFNPGPAPATILQKTAVAAANGGLTLRAIGPGLWGNGLRYLCDTAGIAATNTTDFNLRVYEIVDNNPPVLREIFRNVSCVMDSPRRVDQVLEAGSGFVRAAVPASATRPTTVASPPVDLQTLMQALATMQNGEDSDPLTVSEYSGSEADKTGLFALDKVDLVNIVCIPPADRATQTTPAIYAKALSYCFSRRALLIVDAPWNWDTEQGTLLPALKSDPRNEIDNLLKGSIAKNAAMYFPRLIQPDPLRENRLDRFVSSGLIAGVFARTDATRGVWKAPAGLEASLNGVHSLSVKLTDAENGILNPVGINCLRTFPASGNVVWGARTLRGDDQLGDEYKYIPVRRTALYIEESVYRGTQWAVFEPNDEPLWAQLRLNIGAFMHDLFRQGAFQGQSPRDAYFVKCDKETTTQSDVNRGIVNVTVGFAPLKPAEFVVIKLTQIAGQIQA